MRPVFNLICLIGTVTVAVVLAEAIVVEQLERVPQGWIKSGAANSSQLIRLSITLEHHGLEKLDKTLQEISDPTHSRYGQHLSRDEAFALIQPRQGSVDVVREWLASHGVMESQVKSRGMSIDVSITVGAAEKLLSTKYNIFRQNSGRTALGALAYSVPANVRPHITSIQPTTFFDFASFIMKSPRNSPPSLQDGSLVSHGNSSSAEPKSCELRGRENNNTPECLRKLYKMSNKYTKPHEKSLMGVVGFSTQAAQFDQLEKYLAKYAQYAKGANFTVKLINNGTNPQGINYPSGEANMDVQIAVSMAYQVPVRFYSTGGEDHSFNTDLDMPDTKNHHIEPWLQFLSYLMELPDKDLPQVMAISYGVNEQVVPKPYALKLCQLFGLLSIRGMSIVVASGDQGPGISCQSNDGTNATKFLPAFPGTCPYVTAVGATELSSPERAANFSSGGFSEYWTRPSWQETGFSRYLDLLGDKWKGYYNHSGRGFPDVAAQGKGYPMMNHDKLEEGGVPGREGFCLTVRVDVDKYCSASAPLFASMIAVINDNRLKAGKPPLGFLNHWLYLAANHAFTDITHGRSEGCAGTSHAGGKAPIIPGAGWDAVKGWDPATGLGTPLFDKLQSLAMR